MIEHRPRPHWRRSAARWAAWIALAGLLVFTLAPLAVMIKTALEPNATLFEQAVRWLPQAPTLDNFRRVVGLLDPEAAQALGGSGAELNLLRAALNSVLFTAVVVIGQTLGSSLAAYAFARMEFRGRDAWFGLFLGSMMVPGVVTFIPNFVLLKAVGGLNTFVGMVAPFCLMQAFSVFFLRQCFLSLPRDVEEAARLDGAGPWRIFFQMALPLVSGPVATVALLSGIGAWNEFLWPYLVGRQDSLQVLPVALQTFKTQTPQGQPDWTGLMAASTLAVLPAFVLVLVLGRKLVQSVQFSGSK